MADPAECLTWQEPSIVHYSSAGQPATWWQDYYFVPPPAWKGKRLVIFEIGICPQYRPAFLAHYVFCLTHPHSDFTPYHITSDKAAHFTAEG